MLVRINGSKTLKPPSVHLSSVNLNFAHIQNYYQVGINLREAMINNSLIIHEKITQS